MTILICGGDARQKYAAAELTRLGYSVRYLPLTLGETCPGDIGHADTLLLPIPATRDGVHLNCGMTAPPCLDTLAATGPARIFGGGFSASFVAQMRRTGRTVTDLLTIPSFTEENAALTSEAALGVGMQAAGRSLRGLDVAVIGYGRIASRLTRLLLLCGAHVRVFARKEEARLAATLDGAVAFDIPHLKRALAPVRLIFNTVPAPLLTKEVTRPLRDCVMIELASGKENISLSPREDVKLEFAHSLPGKIFPISAGTIIAQTLDRALQKGGSLT